MIRAVLLILVTLWAFLPKSHLRRYFSAQLAYSVLLGACIVSGYGETTPLYHWLYYLLTSLILLAMLELTVVYMQAHSCPLMLGFVSLSVALGSFWLAYADLPKPLHGYDRFMLLEASTLMFCGSAVGLASGLMGRCNRPVAAALGILWIGLAIFRYGFNLGLPAEIWIRLNLVVPYALVSVAFLYLGWKLRQEC